MHRNDERYPAAVILAWRFGRADAAGRARLFRALAAWVGAMVPGRRQVSVLIERYEAADELERINLIGTLIEAMSDAWMALERQREEQGLLPLAPHLPEPPIPN